MMAAHVYIVEKVTGDGWDLSQDFRQNFLVPFGLGQDPQGR